MTNESIIVDKRLAYLSGLLGRGTNWGDAMCGEEIYEDEGNSSISETSSAAPAAIEDHTELSVQSAPDTNQAPITDVRPDNTNHNLTEPLPNLAGAGGGVSTSSSSNNATTVAEKPYRLHMPGVGGALPKNKAPVAHSSKATYAGVLTPTKSAKGGPKPPVEPLPKQPYLVALTGKKSYKPHMPGVGGTLSKNKSPVAHPTKPNKSLVEGNILPNLVGAGGAVSTSSSSNDATTVVEEPTKSCISAVPDTGALPKKKAKKAQFPKTQDTSYKGGAGSAGGLQIPLPSNYVIDQLPHASIAEAMDPICQLLPLSDFVGNGTKSQTEVGLKIQKVLEEIELPFDKTNELSKEQIPYHKLAAAQFAKVARGNAWESMGKGVPIQIEWIKGYIELILSSHELKKLCSDNGIYYNFDDIVTKILKPGQSEYEGMLHVKLYVKICSGFVNNINNYNRYLERKRSVEGYTLAEHIDAINDKK